VVPERVALVDDASMPVPARAPSAGWPPRKHGGVAAGFRFLRKDRVLALITVAWMALVFGAGFGIVADRPVAEAFQPARSGSA
jgi:hypothetical protein